MEGLYDEFLRFLRRNRCESVFRENFYRFNNCTQFCRDIWEIMVGDEYFINRCFCWAETPQGKAYWMDLSDKWEVHFLEMRNKGLGGS